MIKWWRTSRHTEVSERSMPPIVQRGEAMVVGLSLPSESLVIVPLVLRRVSLNRWVGQRETVLSTLSPIDICLFHSGSSCTQPGFLRDPHLVLSSWNRVYPVFLVVTANEVIGML